MRFVCDSDKKMFCTIVGCFEADIDKTVEDYVRRVSPYIKMLRKTTCIDKEGFSEKIKRHLFPEFLLLFSLDHPLSSGCAEYKKYEILGELSMLKQFLCDVAATWRLEESYVNLVVTIDYLLGKVLGVELSILREEKVSKEDWEVIVSFLNLKAGVLDEVVGEDKRVNGSG